MLHIVLTAPPRAGMRLADALVIQFNLAAYVLDDVMHSKFYVNWIRGFDCVMGRISLFPIGK